MQSENQQFLCDMCPMRRDAELNPDTLKARFWRLHTRICPMYNSYAKVTGTPRPYDPTDDVFLRKVAISVLAAVMIPMLLLKGIRHRNHDIIANL